MKNIAFSGKMCSGKTTLASYLVGKYGYIKVAFADGVYKVAREVFGMKEKDRELLQNIGMKMREIQGDVWINLLKQEMLCKKSQSWGTAVYELTDEGEKQVDFIPMSPVHFTCDDCRFINEVLALQKWGWLVIRLDCSARLRMDRIAKLYPDTPLDAHIHVSEMELDTYAYFDYGLDTGKPLNEVISDLDTIVQRYGGKKDEEMYNMQ